MEKNEEVVMNGFWNRHPRSADALACCAALAVTLLVGLAPGHAATEELEFTDVERQTREFME